MAPLAGSGAIRYQRGTLTAVDLAGVAVRDVVAEIGRQTGGSERIAYGSISSGDQPSVIEADVRRLREEVGWQPPLDFTEGIADTIRWWREHPN